MFRTQKRIKGIVNLFSCDSKKFYLILTLTKTSLLICLSRHHISLKTFYIVSLLASDFLYTNICLNKIYHAE